MAAVPSTKALGCFIELGALPLQRDGAGTDNLRLVLAKSVGSATDTTLRNCATYADLVTAGWVEADFSGYSTGGKLLGPADRTIGYVTTSSPYKATLTISQQTWNPAGGAVNNTPVRAALLYQRTTSTPLSACRVLGLCDTTGSAAGGIYSHTFGVMTDQAV